MIEAQDAVIVNHSGQLRLHWALVLFSSLMGNKNSKHCHMLIRLRGLLLSSFAVFDPTTSNEM